MKRTELTERINNSFFELAPDVFDKIADAIEKAEDDKNEYKDV